MSSKNVMLIVDDKKVNRYTLRSIFEEDFEIAECSNGTEAIEYLTIGERPLIVLLDIIMPGTDGFEVLQFMKAEGFGDIPVVLITASKDETQVKKGYDYKAADFIHKPFDEEVVKHRISYVLRNNNKNQ